ncbi:putative photosynthetic complex assembly protein PuhE [Pararhizobium mangrovi]|uniref:DUF3623 family protein n=1 Tax=Pararhizobium mangrovi TaxID=2590452 RepID=A0A506UBP0_9HYPH|nr:putative photosynthetic complex assembly protein PuhE [Pararhizobium mangrovi]TPW30414.1 DUF3623 family protein [Pararhizobium mangrovi]
MSTYLLPALYALVVWWASTVVIIYLDGLPRSTFKWSMIGATIVFAISLWGLHSSAHDTSITGVYLAFTWGLLAWGWQEMSFYMGYVTGPRNEPCPETCRGWRHFGHAVQTSLYHELAIIAAAAAVFWLTWHGANHIGLWTFMVLWWMHQSAKLNVFFGVRNLNEEFLPEHLTFLKSFLTKRSMNLLFPFSVTISTVITVLLAVAAFSSDASAYEQAGYTFLTVLMALAILEHWMLVLPMPAGRIWEPALKSRGERKPFEADIVVGFLGAGKTTTLKRMLADADPAQKTVVLVNDFGELGVDATVLGDSGADVVELPNGCICCSLRSDLSAQLKEVVAKMKPDRVLIEPSGVADVASLLRVIHQKDLEPLVRSLRLLTVIDAGAFMRDYARMPEYFTMQAALTPVFILNKTDLVSKVELDLVRDTLASLNPDARTIAARYGMLSEGAFSDIAIAEVWQPQEKAEDPHASSAHHAGHAPAHAETSTHRHGHAHAHDHHHEHGAADGPEAHHQHEDELGLQSWAMRTNGTIDPTELRRLLEDAKGGTFGTIERMKGLVPAQTGWLRFDIAGGHISVTAFAAKPAETPRVMAIGSDLDKPALETAFETLSGASEERARRADDAAGRPAFAG